MRIDFLFQKYNVSSADPLLLQYIITISNKIYKVQNLNKCRQLANLDLTCLNPFYGPKATYKNEIKAVLFRNLGMPLVSFCIIHYFYLLFWPFNKTIFIANIIFFIKQIQYIQYRHINTLYYRTRVEIYSLEMIIFFIRYSNTLYISIYAASVNLTGCMNQYVQFFLRNALLRP